MKVIDMHKDKVIVDPAMPERDLADLQRSFNNADIDTHSVEFNLMFPAQIKDGKLIVHVPISEVRGPILSEWAVKAIVEQLGRRDAGKVIDNLVAEYYRQLVIKSM
jgi:hypothetical protein